MHVHARIRVLEHTDRPRVAFADRAEAGRVLAEMLPGAPDATAIVLALPRGGVPVAAPIAEKLGCELRPVAVRKLPLPDAPEMGFGAVTLDGTTTFNHAVMREHGVGMGAAALISERVREEVTRRAGIYPGSEQLPPLEGRRVFIVDDGLATGYTMIATCAMVANHSPAETTVAVPVSPAGTLDLVAPHCDELVCLLAQDLGGFAVASFYGDFHDLGDDEVRALLAHA